jgi:hypothetical protein
MSVMTLAGNHFLLERIIAISDVKYKITREFSENKKSDIKATYEFYCTVVFEGVPSFLDVKLLTVNSTVKDTDDEVFELFDKAEYNAFVLAWKNNRKII